VNATPAIEEGRLGTKACEEANPPDSRLVTRLVVRNYKSIGACDVRPGNLTFLVGPNGSGKSNLLDALRFVGDSLRYSVDHALRDRGGINEVRRRSGGHPTHFGIRLEVDTGSSFGFFAFSVGAKPRGGWAIQREECRVIARPAAPGNADSGGYYRIEEGKIVGSSFSLAPPAVSDRLYLVLAAAFSAFRPFYDALSTMGFYSLNPDQIRDLQPPNPGDLLARDGSNLGSVMARLEANNPAIKARIEGYLARVAPGIAGVDHKALGPKETLEFRQAVKGASHPWRFLAANMSDGTLRALGVLVALFQSSPRASGRLLVGIEEPEAALHPAALGVLADSLRDASERTQVIVTSHSPDLLDDPEISDESILAVLAEDGESKVARLDRPGREALHSHLYTAGELARMDQLRPDPSLVPPANSQLDLFEGLPGE
jgi:predicted ATPase